jgi:hypothetical protein
MSTRWALINADNLVENIVVWDGQGEIFAGRTIVQLNDEEWCNIGASYDANGNPKFIELQE